jgi:hypothetical protein
VRSHAAHSPLSEEISFRGIDYAELSSSHLREESVILNFVLSPDIGRCQMTLVAANSGEASSDTDNQEKRNEERNRQPPNNPVKRSSHRIHR